MQTSAKVPDITELNVFAILKDKTPKFSLFTHFKVLFPRVSMVFHFITILNYHDKGLYFMMNCIVVTTFPRKLSSKKSLEFLFHQIKEVSESETMIAWYPSIRVGRTNTCGSDNYDFFFSYLKLPRTAVFINKRPGLFGSKEQLVLLEGDVS